VEAPPDGEVTADGDVVSDGEGESDGEAVSEDDAVSDGEAESEEEAASDGEAESAGEAGDFVGSSGSDRAIGFVKAIASTVPGPSGSAAFAIRSLLSRPGPPGRRAIIPAAATPSSVACVIAYPSQPPTRWQRRLPGVPMTATVPQTSTAVSPARTARVVAAVFVVANLAVVEGMFFTAAPPAHNTLTAVGRFLGLHLAFVLTLQLLLISRLPYLDRRVGMDRVTTWHRWTGFTIFWLVLLHPTFVLLGYSKLDRISFGAEIPALAGQTPVLFGMVAAALVVLTGLVSVRAARRRLPYEVWHALHLVGYLVIVLAVLHQLSEGSAFKTNALTQFYWWALWAFAVGALITGRVIVPLVRNARHRFTVAAVVPESDDVVSVYVTGRDLGRLNAQAGQFLLWRFPGLNGWFQVNPWSLSAAPDGRRLRLTAKGIGRTSRSLRNLPAGARIFAEGPYGAFTADQRTRADALLVAGGIGVTPIRALLEDERMTGDVVVLYRVRDEAEAVLLGELRELAAARGARLHLVTGRTGAGSPPFEPFGADNLGRLVPDVAGRDTYVCGPAPMTEAVLRGLRRLGVPSRQVHAEVFRL
jgi:predicted ferric reductase